MTDPSMPPQSAVPDFVVKERQRQRRKRRYFWSILATVVLLPLVALVSIFCVNHYRAEADLAAAIAETDKLDPEWRLEQIEKKRLAIPDEENAAIQVKAAIALLPPNWPPNMDLFDLDPPPRRQCDLLLVEMLRPQIMAGSPAAQVAQEALALKKGAFAIAWTPDVLSTSLDNLQHIRRMTWLLTHLAILQSRDHHHDDALRTAVTQLVLARAIGEEPTIISQLVAMNVKSWAVVGLERTLAQGPISEAVLAEAQRQLSDTAKTKGFAAALRGERARVPFLVDNLDNPKKSAAKQTPPNNESESLTDWFARGGTHMRDQAWMLRFYNEALRCAELPPHKMLVELTALESTVHAAPPAAKLTLPAIVKIAEAELRTQALLRCAIVGIAAERFRLKTGHWPENLDELVAAKLLDEVPQDPFDGKPLRYRKTTNGVVIFSIGVKGNYAGDLMDVGREDEPTSVTRCEFRLWDEKHRGQPAWKTETDAP